jgi:thymidylate synthase (FAD)
MIIVKPSVQLLWITPDSAKNIELATRTCYKSEDSYDPQKTAAFLDKIVNQYHHESVIEHGVASFRIVCDRGVSHEIVRHRIASYSQESTRYCNYGKDKFGNQISVLEPPGLTTPQQLVWLRAMESAETAYFQLINAKVSPQIARSVLPNSLKTELVMTTNFRSWLNFLKLRTASGAHPQIREIALEIQKILQSECPEIFGDPPQSSE